MSETDEISQSLSGAATTAATTAAYAAQTVLQRHRAASLERARRVQEEARAAQERLATERQAARAVLSAVDQPGWWSSATPLNAVELADVAVAWAPYDEHAARYARTIDEGAQHRWGSNIDELRQRPDVAAAAAERAGLARGDSADLEQAKAWATRHAPDRLESWQLDYRATDSVQGMNEADRRLIDAWRANVQAERTRATAEGAAPKLDVGDAQVLTAAADELERRAKDAVDEHEAETALDEAAADRAEAAAAWDSAERRQDLAASLEHVDNRTAVSARLTADLDQATPPVAAAIAGRTAGVGKTKGKTRGRTAPQRTAERSR